MLKEKIIEHVSALKDREKHFNILLTTTTTNNDYLFIKYMTILDEIVTEREFLENVLGDV